MPLTAPQALERFRRRLQLAALAKGAGLGLFGVGTVAGLGLLGARLGEVPVPPWTIGWPLWAAVGGVGLLCGMVAFVRARIDDRTAVEHLEARLGTDGLLLAAVDGVELEPAWRTRLERRLEQTDDALPSVRWRALWLRPVGALLVLAAMQMLPPVEPPAAPAEAASLQVQRLSEEVEQLARRTQLDATAAAELRQQVRDLERRVEAGDTGVWRDIDQLSDRVDRERRLAGLDETETPPGEASRGEVAAGGADGPEAAGAGALPAPGAETLAEGLEQLAEADPEQIQELLAGLPEGMQDQVKAALGEDGKVDPAQLPEGDEQREALGDAIGEAAKAALDGLDPQQAAEIGETLAGLAEDFLGGEGPLDTEKLSEQLAEAATEMADLGALDALPDFLKEAMLKAAIDSALAEVKDLDLDKLKELLPDDLSQLEDLAKQVAKLAEGMSGSGEGGSPSAIPGLPDLPELDEATRQRLAGMAEQLGALGEQLAGAMGQGGPSPGEGQPGEGQPGEGQPGAGQPGAGQSGASQGEGVAGIGPGEASGKPGEQGDHAALRMTQQADGALGTREFELPGRDPDQDPLPGEWTPVAVEKAAPEISEARPAGPGSEGAVSKGTPTWQLRLMPRHRDVVRRFFADKKKNK